MAFLKIKFINLQHNILSLHNLHLYNLLLLNFYLIKLIIAVPFILKFSNSFIFLMDLIYLFIITFFIFHHINPTLILFN